MKQQNVHLTQESCRPTAFAEEARCFEGTIIMRRANGDRSQLRLRSQMASEMKKHSNQKRKSRYKPEVLLDTFKDYLIESGYKPGDRIETELQLATRFSVSRSRMREVTTTLCQLGVLESRPRRGTILRSFDPILAGEHLGFHFTVAGLNPADSWEARQIIEEAILPLVVRRITPAILDEMRKAIQRMEDGAANPDEIFWADREFHLLLLKACGNQTLQAFAQVLMALFDQLYRDRPIRPEVYRKSVAEHRQLISAIDQRDTMSAVSILRTHLTVSFETP